MTGPLPAGWSRAGVEHDGLHLDLRTCGPADGPVVLLLHGFPQSSRSWTAVGDRLAAAGLHVVAPDQRGYSPGARPDDVDAYEVERLVADAGAVLDTVAGPGAAAHVVGHDWGACVAWWLAARSPERVRTLTALSIPHLAAFGAALRHDPEQQRLSRYISVFREPAGVAESALAADGYARFRALFDGVVATDDVEAYVDLMAGGALGAALTWYRAMDASINDLEPVRVPTTYVWGARDRAVAASGARACGQHVAADYRFVELPEQGHWLPDEVPGVVADAVVERVRSVRT